MTSTAGCFCHAWVQVQRKIRQGRILRATCQTRGNSFSSDLTFPLGILENCFCEYQSIMNEFSSPFPFLTLVKMCTITGINPNSLNYCKPRPYDPRQLNVSWTICIDQQLNVIGYDTPSSRFTSLVPVRGLDVIGTLQAIVAIKVPGLVR